MSKDGTKAAMIKPRKDHPTFWNNLSEYCTAYAHASSLNGFQYLAEKRSVFERFYWFILIGISLGLCIWMILETYNGWTTSPIIISFGKTPTLVHQIPFPAVTVCSSKRIKQAVYNFSQEYARLSDLNIQYDSPPALVEEIYKLKDIGLLCEHPNEVHQYSRKVASPNVIDTFSKVAPQLEEVIWALQFVDSFNYSNHKFFTKILLEDGLCFTFNALDRDKIYTNETYHYKDFLRHHQDSFGWTLESGYQNSAALDTYPRRVKVASQKVALTLFLGRNEQDFDYYCDCVESGFKVFLHHPGELPGKNARYFDVPLDTKVSLAIKPDVTKASAELEKYYPNKRGCYFSTERRLRFYTQYSKVNCELECLTNLTLEECGCAAYYMPRAVDTPICGIDSFGCIEDAHSKMISLSLDKIEASCDCLPACTSLTYNADAFQNDLVLETAFELYKAHNDNVSGLRLAVAELFFDKNEFTALERNELYGTTEFLANCGGILGLFTGFSFVSLMEILYFLTIRWMVNLKKNGLHH